jgi:hypothetical protein
MNWGCCPDGRDRASCLVLVDEHTLPYKRHATRKQMKHLLLFISLLLAASAATAQTFTLAWCKIAGGGGASTNGQYALSGTIGQPDAGGAMTGGNYSLTGGFWSLIAVVPTQGAPTLSITHSGTSVIVSWPYPSVGWTLKQNANVAAANGWQNSGYPISNDGTNNSITITAPTGSLFFRLAR